MPVFLLAAITMKRHLGFNVRLPPSDGDDNETVRRPLDNRHQYHGASGEAQQADVRLTCQLCSECVIELHPVVRLTDTHGQVSFGDRVIVSKDYAGRFYVESQVDMGVLGGV